MSALLLDGKKLASTSEIEITKEVSELKSHGINPTLATILVGNDPASETYVRMKRNTCKRVGMESIAVELSESTTTDELLNTINDLNKDNSVFDQSRELGLARVVPMAGTARWPVASRNVKNFQLRYWNGFGGGARGASSNYRSAKRNGRRRY